MDATNIMNLSLFLTILSVSLFGVLSEIPSSCKHLECPGYNVIHVGNDFEIRCYNSTVWISTSPIDSASLVDATRVGFMRYFLIVFIQIVGCFLLRFFSNMVKFSQSFLKSHHLSSCRRTLSLKSIMSST